MARSTPQPHARAQARFWFGGLLLVLAASLEGGVLALAAQAEGADDGSGPTITFVLGSGQTCDVQPRPSSITVSGGTKVMLVNDTGSDASIELDGNLQPSVLKSGSNVAISLDAGQHQIQLVLACGSSSTATVIVNPLRGSTRTTGTAAGGPRPGTRQTVDGANPPGASSSTGPPQTVSVRTSTLASPSPAIGASPAGLDQSGTSPGFWLLASVATVCVLGVSAAIIRSITRSSA
jgi:hypothetical protein